MTVFRKWRSEVGLSRFNKEVSAVSCLVFFWFVCLVCFGFFFSEITISFIISLSQKKKKQQKFFLKDHPLVLYIFSCYRTMLFSLVLPAFGYVNKEAVPLDCTTETNCQQCINLFEKW